MLHTFLFDEYDAYGEIPIPGTGALHLPKGEVTITFHTRVAVAGGHPNPGLAIPDLSMTIDPPAGVAEPQVTKDIGGSTFINHDARRRVWVAQIPAEGEYRIQTGGNVGAFINPHLAFGHSNSANSLPWVFAALFVFGLVDLGIAVWLFLRVRRAAPLAAPQPFGFDFTDLDRYTPTADGIRAEQLKTIAGLRDSGAITEDEFQAEKRRILGG